MPLPWQADAPSYGFGPGPLSWLPQPAVWRELALDVQREVPGSTYETYRAALRLRRSLELGTGSLTWLTGWGEDVVALGNRNVTVLANVGATDLELPADTVVLVSSGEPREVDGVVILPADTTVWARLVRA